MKIDTMIELLQEMKAVSRFGGSTQVMFDHGTGQHPIRQIALDETLNESTVIAMTPRKVRLERMRSRYAFA